VEGVDCVFIGLSDLAVRLGVPGDMSSPPLLQAVSEVEAACSRHGPALGVPVTSPELAAKYRDQGARFLATGDVAIMAQGMRHFVEEVTRSVG
jgi:4-hydroxy-2-oxoheptanedioate aldolase